MKTILLHGPSGCGKDTQAKLLVDKYDFENIGTGEMFREMYMAGDIDAIRAREYWNKGKFVPNELVYKMFSKWLDRFNNEKDWILVSVVREVNQIPLLDNILKERNRKIDTFIHFTLSDELAIERMSLRWVCNSCMAVYHEKYKPEKVKGYCDVCGLKLEQREDDKIEKIQVRLAEYKRTIEPILQEYKNRGVLIEVDAAPSIEAIHQDLIKVLNL